MTRRSVWMFAACTALVLAPTLLSPIPIRAQDGSSRATATSDVDYDDPSNWLCRPGRDDACAVDLTTTVVFPDGTLATEEWGSDPDAPVDCFYVYPTVSTDQTPNSDLEADPAERSVIRSQFARFRSHCRTFAPMYRQVTLAALRAGMAGNSMDVDREMPYADVRAAWNHYLESDNRGRGVVLVGHSQGSSVLRRLIQEEIDGEPIQSRIVSALLLGMNIAVPEGRDVGGAFEAMPLCRSRTQTGCVVTYVSFAADEPPPADALFGSVPSEDQVAGCTNPASLAGDRSELAAYFSTDSADEGRWVDGKAITTPFVRLPGLVSGECVSGERGSYLSVSVHAAPGGPRTDDIGGRVVTEGEVQGAWGLHLIDVNLGMGNLVELVAEQTRSYLAE